MKSPETDSSWPNALVLHYVVLGLLAIGGVTYWLLKPEALNPMADPRAAEAMALVQTHRAYDAPTLLQALSNRVKALEERGKGVRLGEWRVERKQEGLYVIKVWVREEGTREWFERAYEWQVNLTRRAVAPLTNPAADLMPPTPSRPNGMVPGLPAP